MADATLRPFAFGLNHPEGLAWRADCGLFCGGEGGEIYRVDLSSESFVTVANTGGFVLGMAFGPDARLYVCDMGRKAVLGIDVLHGGPEKRVAQPESGWRTPNHLVFAQTGTMYVSDSGSWGGHDGSVVAVTENEARVIAGGGEFTNGLALAPDETWLYAVESAASRVVRYPVLAGADVGPKEVFAELPQTVPDGLAFAADGSLLVSCYRPDAIYRVGRDGEPTILASDWTGLSLSAPTNIAYTEIGWVTANLAGRHLTALVVDLAGAELNYTR